MNLNFRPLKAEEIDVRVGTIGNGYAMLLIYKDARCDQGILDESVGPMNWQRDHKEVKGNMFGGIGIRDTDTGEFIWKWDCGTESTTEKEKGEASDSFKRAGVNWGIGRELYTAPPIKVSCQTTPYAGKNGRTYYSLANRFQFYGAYVAAVNINEDHKILGIEIADNRGYTLFKFGYSKREETNKAPAENEVPSVEPSSPTIDERNAKVLIQTCESHGHSVEGMCKQYHVSNVMQLTWQTYNDIMHLFANETEKQNAARAEFEPKQNNQVSFEDIPSEYGVQENLGL